jgi:carboxyl-terminal processing protease
MKNLCAIQKGCVKTNSTLKSLRKTVCFSLLLLSGTAFSQQEVCQKAPDLISAIHKFHVQPVAVNDDWSKRVFDNILYSLDPLGLLFSETDLQPLQSYQTLLDDMLNANNSCTWVSSFVHVYEKAKTDYGTWLNHTLAQPLDFTAEEYFNFNLYTPRPFAGNTHELESRRRAYIKYQVLLRMHQESQRDSLKRLPPEFEALARQKIKVREFQNIQRPLQKAGTSEKLIGSVILKSIANAFDPHTEFLSATENDDFKSSLSLSHLSFGFSLSQNALGAIFISSVTPGGPAWKSDIIHNGDVLISIEPASEPVVNTLDYDFEEILELINSNAVYEATFTVKKPGGHITQTTLFKEKLESTDNTVNGFVLKGAKNIGYISLPSFYFDWDDNTGEKGCAADVAKVIIKLSHEKLDGLILDLRFNGGGSIQQALNLAGIFIDYGPVILYKEAAQPVEILKDLTKGSIYKGPLIIMVNGLSASASELLAATLQDYNRALVVGTKTFGKGTGQDIFPLPDFDFLKVTSSKFYRLTGKTYQHTGVMPAIILPDLTKVLAPSEDDFPNVLPADSVSRKVYYSPLPKIPIELLAAKSKERISASASFQHIDRILNTLTKPVPLQIKNFSDYVALANNYPTTVTTKAYTVTLSVFENELFQVDGYKKEIAKTLITEIENSFYIQEAYFILSDYIVAQKK